MLIFQQPSEELAAYQRRRMTHYMAHVLRKRCPNIHDRASIVSTLHMARFDPVAIETLWAEAVLSTAIKASMQ